MKIRTMADLQRHLDKDINIYNEFVRVYGKYDSLTNIAGDKYEAISAIQLESSFTESIDEILDNLINNNLFCNEIPNNVKYLMARWLKTNTNADAEKIKIALELFKN